MLRVRGDSGFDSEFRRIDGRDAEHSSNVPSLVIFAPDSPCEASIGSWMAEDDEHLNVTLPSDLTFENLHHRHP